MAPRRAPDAMISLAALLEALERWAVARGSRDVNTLLRPAQRVTWKTAPQAEVLAAVADLFVGLFGLAPNGVLPSKKLSMSLEKWHEQSPVNFGTLTMAVWGPRTAELLRMVAAKFRLLKDDATAKAVCLRKAPMPGPTPKAYLSGRRVLAYSFLIARMLRAFLSF